MRRWVNWLLSKMGRSPLETRELPGSKDSQGGDPRERRAGRAPHAGQSWTEQATDAALQESSLLPLPLGGGGSGPSPPIFRQEKHFHVLLESWLVALTAVDLLGQLSCKVASLTSPCVCPELQKPSRGWQHAPCHPLLPSHPYPGSDSSSSSRGTSMAPAAPGRHGTVTSFTVPVSSPSFFRSTSLVRMVSDSMVF